MIEKVSSQNNIRETDEIINKLNNLEKILIYRTDRLEKLIRYYNINRSCCMECINFESQSSTNLPNPYEIHLGLHTISFSTQNQSGLPLKIIDYPVTGRNNLNIPYDLTIKISPACKNLMMEISNFATLSWDIFDENGNPIPSVPPSPAPKNVTSHFIEMPGKVELIKFISQNEAGIFNMCCTSENK